MQRNYHCFCGYKEVLTVDRDWMKLGKLIFFLFFLFPLFLWNFLSYLGGILYPFSAFFRSLLFALFSVFLFCQILVSLSSSLTTLKVSFASSTISSRLPLTSLSSEFKFNFLIEARFEPHSFSCSLFLFSSFLWVLIEPRVIVLFTDFSFYLAFFFPLLSWTTSPTSQSINPYWPLFPISVFSFAF